MVACGTNTYHCMELTIANANPEATMRWADLFYDDENGLEFYLGPIGTSLTANDDGTYSILEPSDPNINLDDWLWKNTMGDLGPCYVSQATQDKVVSHEWINGKLNLDANYEPFFDSSRIYPFVILDRSQTDEIAAIETDITRLVTEKCAVWVSQGGVEAEWDQYLADMEKMGLSRYLEIYQAKLS
ncbi:MAG: hypothetical protein GX558_11000 [Clostridiales bacterium]|nr:hypothetical protein [Clostridiales bacterium]